MNENQIDWATANFRQMYRVKPKLKPPVDMVISQIVGREIYTQDPRLIKLIVKWKKMKSDDEPDNFLNDSRKIEELKQVLNQNL